MTSHDACPGGTLAASSRRAGSRYRRTGASPSTRPARRWGIDSTPTLIVNGAVRPGLPSWDELAALIEAEARRQHQEAQKAKAAA